MPRSPHTIFDDNVGGNPQRVESGDDSKGVPAWRVTVRYDQLDTVQQSVGLVRAVIENDPFRTQYLGNGVAAGQRRG